MRFKNLGKAVAGAALGLTLAFTSVTPALAATITIDNAVNNETYTAYKLFDVSYGTADDGTAKGPYAYYTSNELLVNALRDNAGVKFTQAPATGNWYVNDEGFDAEKVADYLSGQIDNFSALGLVQADDPATASSGTVSFNDLNPGYYFVDSTLGSLCALNTAADNATIKEKNTVPSIDKKVYEDSSESYVDDFATIDVIDTIHYKLTVTTGSNNQSAGTGIDADYVIEDTLPEGVKVDLGSVSITGWDKGSEGDFDAKLEGQKLTITLFSDGELANLKQGNSIEIYYDAVPDSNLETMALHTNMVELKYKDKVRDQDQVSVKTYQIGKDVNGNSTITKVDGDNPEQKLSGVKFVLENDNGQYAQFESIDGQSYLSQWGSKENADELVTDGNGNIFAYGLDAGDYTLIETETLDGYNLLNGTIAVEIGPDGTVKYDLTSDEDPADASITIKNNAGSLLPTTGGMGTVALYAAGGALVVAAGVVLVVRRRMNNEA